MILSKNIKINEAAKRILVNVETSQNHKFTKLLFYNSENYPDIEKAVDLTNLLKGTSNSEDFYIKAEDVNLNNFIGLFFLEFTTDEEENPEECEYPIESEVFPVANLTKYHLCILENILAIDIEDCKIYYKNSKDCNECSDFLFLTNTLLESLYIAILNEFFEEACKIISNLNEICDNCACYNKRVIDMNYSGVYCSTEIDCVTCNVILKY